MNREENHKEKLILDAAEKIFLSKGYNAAKTLEIAEAAGVNHALLHYYFRTKENLFNTVFSQKIEFFIESFQNLFHDDLPFFELIRSIIETQYDFLSRNPQLPYFIINEIIANDQHRNLFREKFFLRLTDCMKNTELLLQKEIEKGNIKDIRLPDLIISIASLNVFFFLIRPAIEDLAKSESKEDISIILKERKKVHVDQIVEWIKK